ncbi:MAG: SBBP repeat-containing protein [Turneriella sp.]
MHSRICCVIFLLLTACSNYGDKMLQSASSTTTGTVTPSGAGTRSGTEDLTWNKAVGGSNAERSYKTAVDSSGNVYVIGANQNFVSGVSGNDWVIRKYNSAGTEITAGWPIAANGSANASDVPQAIVVDKNGDIYVAGSCIVTGSSYADWCIKKFSASGIENTAQWNLRFSSSFDQTDTIQALAVDSQNNLYVAGTGFNLVTAGSSAGDWWIKKFSSTAIEDQTNWNKKFDGGAGATVNDLVIDAGDNVYAVGYGYNLINGTSGYDWWLKKFSSIGVEDTGNWDKKFPVSGSAEEVAYGVALDSSGNVYVVGCGTNLVSASSGVDWWLKKFSSSGIEDTLNWDKKFSSSGTQEDRAFSVAVSAAGYVYVAGFGTNLLSVSSGNDGWVKRFTTSGAEDTTNWNKTIGTSGVDQMNKVTLSGSGHVYVSGFGNNLVNGSSQADWWIKKYTE